MVQDIGKQDVFNHFPTPDPFPGGIELQGFHRNLASGGGGGVELQVSRHEAPETGDEGAVLENFSDFECGKWWNCLKLL